MKRLLLLLIAICLGGKLFGMERMGGNGLCILDLSSFTEEFLNEDSFFLDKAFNRHLNTTKLIPPKEGGLSRIADYVSKLGSLKEIDCSNCRNCTFKALAKIPGKIERLDFSNCFRRLNSHFELLDDSRLKYLWFHDRRINVCCKRHQFEPKNNLIDLRLRGLNITDFLVQYFPDRLEFLDVGGTKISDGIREFVARAKFLDHLLLDKCPITDTLLPYLIQANLRGLHIGECEKLTAEGLTCFFTKYGKDIKRQTRTAPKLEDLQLDFCKVKQDVFKALSRFANLRRISLFGCKGFKPEYLQHIWNLPRLEAIDLSWLKINPEAFSKLGRPLNLRYVVLADEEGEGHNVIDLQENSHLYVDNSLESLASAPGFGDDEEVVIYPKMDDLSPKKEKLEASNSTSTSPLKKLWMRLGIKKGKRRSR